MCQPRTQQELVCEVFSSIKTLDHKFERMVLVATNLQLPAGSGVERGMDGIHF